jgi:hypothetical protein
VSTSAPAGVTSLDGLTTPLDASPASADNGDVPSDLVIDPGVPIVSRGGEAALMALTGVSWGRLTGRRGPLAGLGVGWTL